MSDGRVGPQRNLTRAAAGWGLQGIPEGPGARQGVIRIQTVLGERAALTREESRRTPVTAPGPLRTHPPPTPGPLPLITLPPDQAAPAAWSKAPQGIPPAVTHNHPPTSSPLSHPPICPDQWPDGRWSSPPLIFSLRSNKWGPRARSTASQIQAPSRGPRVRPTGNPLTSAPPSAGSKKPRRALKPPGGKGTPPVFTLLQKRSPIAGREP